MELTFNGKPITVRQLTVKEVADYMDNIQREPTTADLLMNRSMTEQIVRLSTGLTSEDINGDVVLSELEKLWDAVEQENPSFAGLLERLSAAGKEILEQMAKADRQSGAVPVLLSDSTATAE